MKLLLFTVFVCLTSWTHASANFRNTCSQVGNTMTGLRTAIGNIKMTANRLGHWDISSQCDEASRHLETAQSSWGGISARYSSFPWQARSCREADTVKKRLSLCGSSLESIYSRCRHPWYQPYINSCKRNYNGCQSGCDKIWKWPTPPGYYPPTPSQRYWSSKRDVDGHPICPAGEDACPVSPFSENIECLDTQRELTSCGGCVMAGEGQDCSKIQGARGVGCQEGKCVVFSAAKGYELNVQGVPVRV